MSGRLTCPECGTILRIRDRSFVGRKVKCPECKVALQIEAADQDDHLVFRRLPVADIAVAEQPKQSSQSRRSQSKTAVAANRSWISRVISSPLTAIYLVMIAVISLLVVLAWNPRLRFTSRQPVPITRAPESTAESVVSPTAAVEDATGTNESHETDAIVALPTALDDSNCISAIEPANFAGQSAESPIAEEKQATPVTAPAKIDVESKLSQKIRSYKQPKISRRTMIDALQEQVGVPIRYDIEELGSDSLDDSVTFELENTTLGAVMKSVADAAGWQVVIEDTGIRLKKKE